ncbi:toxin-antitoxin system YwqK family antitoxin [Pedobacter sp. ASV28]|uniref:toxin-antitoxin system YwqK family antitoxin n=1 Tax=Pedobacter sp. ASV28 TaxID=2795123 RepID=UPI0018ED08F8|nr:hypothetical protein [Pedobacter sp. ASV28]
MQRCYLILMLWLCTYSLGQAQSYKKNLALESYRHHVAYDDHKISFYTQPMDIQLGKAEADKKYYWFSNREIKVTQGGFSGRLLHGTYSDYYLNNNLKEQGEFKMGLKEGEWNSWNEQGILLARIRYRRGEANGHFYKYDQTGRLVQEGTYAHGQINGQLKRYLENDSIAVDRYKEGVLQPVKVKSRPSWFKRLFKKKKKEAEIAKKS